MANANLALRPKNLLFIFISIIKLKI